MARPGYIEAKKRVEIAQHDLIQSQRSLESVETDAFYAPMPEDLKEIHRGDKRRAIHAATLELAEAEQELGVFNVKPPRVERDYFDFHVLISVSMKAEMHAAMGMRQQTDAISRAELIRRALTAYLA